ncbi:MAG: hypothetical protein RDV48_02765 [Candidatus Eremiobacteraeota bacterium]|nr:hypothetical protein [Candidatus Eremiobacteraeota bacterium]
MLSMLKDNPIYFKESRGLSRNRNLLFQNVANAVVYPLILVAPFLIVAFITLADINGGTRDFARRLTEILKGCFYFSAGIQFFYVLIASANATQFAFTREKEQKTYDSLICSLMTPQEILTGKLFTALYPVIGTLVLYSPLFFIMGLLSGAALEGLIVVFLFSIAFSLFCGVVSLYSSALAPTGQKAQSYLTSFMALLIIATWIGDWIGNGILHTMGGHTFPFLPFLVFFNPGTGYASAMYLMAGAKHYNCMSDPYSYFHLFWLVCLLTMALFSFMFWRATLRKLGEIAKE